MDKRSGLCHQLKTKKYAWISSGYVYIFFKKSEKEQTQYLKEEERNNPLNEEQNIDENENDNNKDNFDNLLT